MRLGCQGGVVGLCVHVLPKQHIVGITGRNDLDVRVGYIKTPDPNAGPVIAAIYLNHAAHNFFNGSHNGCIILVFKILQVVYLRLGYDQCVARKRRVNIQEGKGFIVFVYFVAGDLATDNAGKD